MVLENTGIHFRFFNNSATVNCEAYLYTILIELWALGWSDFLEEKNPNLPYCAKLC